MPCGDAPSPIGTVRGKLGVPPFKRGLKGHLIALLCIVNYVRLTSRRYDRKHLARQTLELVESKLY